MSKVLVFGGQPTTNLGLIQALGQAGHEVSLMTLKTGKTDFLSPDRVSRYIKNVYAVNAKGDEAWYRHLSEVCKKDNYTVILPSTDIAAVTIDRLAAKLGVICPHISDGYGKIEQYSEKYLQCKLAKDAGFKVPNSVVVKKGDDNDIALEQVSYPCFCKSEARYKGSKATMQKCNNREELLRHIEKIFQGIDDEILIQEYIEVETEYAIPGVCCNNDVVIPLAIKKLLNSKGKHRGVTVQGQIIKAEELGECIKSSVLLLKSMHYQGMFDLEVMKSKGEFYFCELNLRCGATVGAVTRAGVNLPDLFIQKLLNPDTPYNKILPKYNMIFYNEKTLYEEYDEKVLPKKIMKNIIKSSDVSLLRGLNDSNPYRAFGLRYHVNKIVKILK